MATIALAQSNDGKTADAPPRAFNAACAKTAIEKRDNAIIAAIDAFAAAFKNIVTQRKAAVMAAFDKTNQKEYKNAVKNAIKTFRVAKKAARRAYNETRQQAHKTFGNEIKTCGENEGVDHGGAGEDNL